MLPGLLALALALAPEAPALDAGAEPEPASNQAVVFYNARLALRDKQPNEALRLWLLRNSLESRGERPVRDGDFESVVWASLGDLALCPDGFPHDDNGVGLWPLAEHNWLVQTVGAGPPFDLPVPFEAFKVEQQQRLVSLHDVLTPGELESVAFFRTSCYLGYGLSLESGQLPWTELSDRLAVGLLLRQFLVKSLKTLVREKVESVAAIEARIFDLDLVLAELQARRARQENFEKQVESQRYGVPPQAAKKVPTWPKDSPQAEFLRKTLAWEASDWLSLNRQRRLFLFAQARSVPEHKYEVVPLNLAILDALVARGSGDEVEAWIGFLEASGSPELRRAVTSGDRGKRLLELGGGTGFRERAIVALHRGVEDLETGQLKEALTSFAYAMANADSGPEASATLALARRWLSFVLSHYETSDEVIATLKALVPRQHYNAVIEDLAWKAAFRVDLASFERVARSARRGSSFDSSLDRLRLMASGKLDELGKSLRESAETEPYFTLRFMKQLLERCEAEDAQVRSNNVPLLHMVVTLLNELGASAGERNANARTVAELTSRAQAILEGLRVYDTSLQGKARALAPSHEAFAGNVRVAPTDPLPWPFPLPEPEAPSAFVPLKLEPVEWRDEAGALVFGWRVTE